MQEEIFVPQSEHLASIAHNVLNDFLGIPCQPLETMSSPPLDTRGARVFISGGWEGAVALGCSEALARKVASVMFAKTPQDMTVEEIEDAVGELANIIGGNIKALLPGPSELSLPIQGTDVEVGDIACRLDLETEEDEPFFIMIYA